MCGKSQSELTLDRLFDIVFAERSGSFCVLFECYLDDSKDQRQEFAYVCAGFYGARWAWKNFNAAWNRQLKAEGIGYFKTSEFKSLTGEFQKFRLLAPPMGRTAASLVRERLFGVLENTVGLRGVGVAVPVEVFRDVAAIPGADKVFGDITKVYPRAFEAVLALAIEKACYKRDKLAFAHDDGPDFPELFSLYHQFKNLNKTFSKQMAGFIPLDDKVTPALQIADIFANDIMGKTVEFLKDGQPNGRDVWLYGRSSVHAWSMEFGEFVLKQNLERLDLPIPERLLTKKSEVPRFPVPLNKRSG